MGGGGVVGEEQVVYILHLHFIKFILLVEDFTRLDSNVCIFSANSGNDVFLLSSLINKNCFDFLILIRSTIIPELNKLPQQSPSNENHYYLLISSFKLWLYHNRVKATI